MHVRIYLDNSVAVQYILFDVDLFVSRINWQVRKYVSYLPDPEAFAVDAISIL
jgi:hypothetical protein